MLVPGQVMEQSGETLLKTHGNIHAFNLERRPLSVVQPMSEDEPVPVQISDREVS